MQVMKAWNRYWFAPAPYLDLAVVRIIAVGFLLYESIFRGSIYDWAMDSAALPDAMWQPLIIMKVLNVPFGWGMRPGVEVIQWFHLIWLVAGVFALVGLFTRSSMAVFAAAYVYLQSFIYSFGDFHHPEAVMAVALSVLALSSCGRVLSVDALVRQRRQDAADDLLAMNEPATGFAMTARWACFSPSSTSSCCLCRLACCSFRRLLGWRWCFPSCAGSTFLGLCFHTGIYITLEAPFFHWMALYAVFIPWSEALRRWPRLFRAGPFLRTTFS
jgi:hypothetical protein